MMKWSKLVVCAESFGKVARIRMDELARIRLVAVRRGVWFRVLNRLERGLVNLTLQVTKKIRSNVLAKALYSVVRRLLEALESKVRLSIRQVGTLLARKLSLIAQEWGNTLARIWSYDRSFMKFLAVMHINNPGVFKP